MVPAVSTVDVRAEDVRLIPTDRAKVAAGRASPAYVCSSSSVIGAR